MERPVIRSLAPGDLTAVLAIQSDSPGVARWSAAEYARVARGELPGWVADASGRVLGFLVARTAADEIEILNLAVAPEARRAGVATLLLRQAIDDARKRGMRRAFLEVRESNRVAQLLYEQQGFSVSGRRPGYYADPPEDALVLARTI